MRRSVEIPGSRPVFRPRSTRYSRREFLRKAAVGGVFLAAGSSAVGLAAAEFMRGEDQKLAPLVGQPIEGEELRQFLTDPSGEIFEIPLRRRPLLSDEQIIAWTKPGEPVRAKPYYGVTYPSNNPSLGRFEGPDGNFYGRWYLADNVPAFKNKNGRLEPLLDEKGNQVKLDGVFIAGNFLIKSSDK